MYSMNTEEKNITQDEPSTNGKQSSTPQDEPNYKELYFRTNADFQNYKRRIERERIEWTNIMQADVIEKILPIVDDLESAIQAAIKHHDITLTAWIEGFQLVLKKFKKILSDLGVEEIVASGQFNPEQHEALMHVQSTEHTSGQIVQKLSSGYIFKGKVIKYARVSVAK